MGKKPAKLTPYRLALNQYDKCLIEAALERHRGAIVATSEELGINRKTLYAKMALYGIEDIRR